MTAKNNLIAIALLLVPAMLHAAASDDERGWWFSERFQGTSNAAGIVLKSNPAVGYTFNGHVQMYGGAPYYFTRQSAAGSSSASTSFVNGVGNAFTGLLITAASDSFKYSSDLVVTAPTGDRTQGFSTGHVTADWTNTFSRPFSSFTPYGSDGVANTVSDTEFFVRPFTTNGAVLHFEGGALFKLASHLNAGASAYAVRAAGQQEIVSKVVEVPSSQSPQTSSSSTPPANGSSKNNGVLSTISQAAQSAGLGNGKGKQSIFETSHQTVTTADALDDHGFSTWLSVRPNSTVDFQIGFSRSVDYQLNSMFFGVGFRVGH